MASFNTPYGLCSVIDSRGLLGVSEDEDGCAVITIGKNMVIRCKISDQKQLNSWSTRMSKLTSKVVYDSVNGNYVGVFDNIYIKQWTTIDSSIEKLKKRTMRNEIHDILLHKKTSFSKPSLFIIFKNGSCKELGSLLSSKDEPLISILQPDEVVVTAKIISDEEKFLIIVAKFQNKYHLCYCAQLEEDNYSIISETVKKVKLRRQGASMLGQCILQEDKGNSLLTYWSDGFLYSLPLPFSEEKNNVGKFLGTIHTVSRKFDVAMLPVSYNQIAFYASDLSHEGAVLGIYNVKFGLFQAQTSFKLFNKPPQMWVVENNIVILMGQRLICVPFTLQAELLSAIACSKALHYKPPSLTQEISAVIPNVTWEKTQKVVTDVLSDSPEKIRELLSVCSAEGWSEYGVCQFVLEKLLEAKDYNGLQWCLHTFIDIPEDFIVKLLVAVLNDNDTDIWMIDESDDFAIEDNPKLKFVNKILQLPINDINLLTSLRLYFKFEDCLMLLNHLSNIEQNCDRNILMWTIVLLDAFYQQFILSRDAKVLNIMVELKDKIENEIASMNGFKNLLPLLIGFKKGKAILKSQFHNTSYTVEKFRLYH